MSDETNQQTQEAAEPAAETVQAEPEPVVEAEPETPAPDPQHEERERIAAGRAALTTARESDEAKFIDRLIDKAKFQHVVVEGREDALRLLFVELINEEKALAEPQPAEDNVVHIPSAWTQHDDSGKQVTVRDDGSGPVATEGEATN